MIGAAGANRDPLSFGARYYRRVYQRSAVETERVIDLHGRSDGEAAA